MEAVRLLEVGPGRWPSTKKETISAEGQSLATDGSCQLLIVSIGEFPFHHVVNYV